MSEIAKEDKLFDEVRQLRTQIEKLEATITMQAVGVKKDVWMNKKALMAYLEIGSGTVNNYVSRNMIVKRGLLYSLRSYLEYAGIIKGGSR